MTLPTVGGSEGVYGTLLNNHINIEHNIDGTHNGAIAYPVDSVSTAVLTKYLTGTTDADATTNVAHGVTATNILHVSAIIFHSGVTYFVYDMQMSASLISAFTLAYDATNIILGNVGGNNQSRAYRIKIDYTV